MPARRTARSAPFRLLALLVPLLLGACSAMSGGERGSGERIDIPPAPGERQAAAQPSATGPARTGTVVGARVAQLRGDLATLQGQVRSQAAEHQSLRGSMATSAGRYQGHVAQINARLQSGTTPGNPELVAQWNQAQRELGTIEEESRRLTLLSSRVAQSASMAGFILDSARAAYGLSGAVEQDHRDLAALEDEVNRTMVQIDRLLNELAEDSNRQSAAVAAERRNLSTLSLAIQQGQLLGTSLANRGLMPAAPAAAPRAARSTGRPTALSRGAAQPLVVIRFEGGRTPDYQQPLYDAVSRALERRPTATFDVVAVSPAPGPAAETARAAGSARRNAEGVMRTLVEMGLPAQRVGLSGNQSSSVQGSEVHIYVR